MALPNVGMLSLYAGPPEVIEVAREVSQANGACEEKGKKKKVKLSQKKIDAYMRMAPPRPLIRFDPEKILRLMDPEDPELLRIGLEMMEIAESCVADHQAFQDKKKSICEQFLTTGEAFIEVIDNEAE